MRTRLLASVLLCLCSCSETNDSQYPDLKEAVKQGAVMRGILVSWLPVSSKDIKVSNTDEAVIASWKYYETWHVPVECTVINPFTVQPPEINRDWWPENIPPVSEMKERRIYYSCNGQEYLVLDSDKREGFYWKNN